MADRTGARSGTTTGGIGTGRGIGAGTGGGTGLATCASGAGGGVFAGTGTFAGAGAGVGAGNGSEAATFAGADGGVGTTGEGSAVAGAVAAADAGTVAAMAGGFGIDGALTVAGEASLFAGADRPNIHHAAMPMQTTATAPPAITPTGSFFPGLERGAGTGIGDAASRSFPHCLQNLAPGLLEAPQSLQETSVRAVGIALGTGSGGATTASDSPQFLQNLAAS